jgi:hypothetical protein
VSHNRLVFDGLAELRRELRALPQALRGEAENEVEAAANQAALEVRSGYKQGKTGKLVEGVVVEEVSSGARLFAGRVVLSKDPLAMIYENGTQVRHTELGYNRGRMPPAHVFIPAMIRHRKDMYDRLRDMMRRHGLKVVG